MIDYRYIEAFLAVVNTNSLSKAAESLYVSQSSISNGSASWKRRSVLS